MGIHTVGMVDVDTFCVKAVTDIKVVSMDTVGY